ncbi:MAG: hypothetical protein JNL74_11285 [Fibrobacteres bacterium]|nr:hypothetical protein [Fibrobacterota bacterium]
MKSSRKIGPSCIIGAHKKIIIPCTCGKRPDGTARTVVIEHIWGTELPKNPTKAEIKRASTYRIIKDTVFCKKCGNVDKSEFEDTLVSQCKLDSKSW